MLKTLKKTVIPEWVSQIEDFCVDRGPRNNAE
jgi:hypothetical protein